MADPAFNGAGKKVGLEIWRIEKLKPVKVKAEDHGSFYSGDSYIVLNTKQRSTALEWDIHFWLGKDTSQDEMGVAAYKTVELDDSLGGGPVQYREVEGHESQQFLRLFKGGVKVLEGGVDSGFRKVERDVYETRLLQVKGRKAARVRQVELNRTSLNSGDVFILDCGLDIYQWNGKDAHRLEKAKALDVTSGIKDQERGGRAKIHVLTQGVDDAGKEAFWKPLGGEGAVADSSAGGDDTAFEKAAPGKLFRVVGKDFQKVEGPLKKETLATSDIYIVDCDTELYVWLGRGADAKAKKEAMITGGNYLTKNSKPNWVPLQRVVEGAETPIFKAKFKGWQDAPKGAMKQLGYTGNTAKVEAKPVDVKALMKKQAMMDQEKMPDDGGGKIEIWRVEDFKPVVWPKERHGQFYAGDSFVIQYTYMDMGREAYLIYFWQGRDSSNDEKGASALIAKDMDDALAGAATQVRVVQGKEPNHFLTLFKGRMVVMDGGKASGFKNTDDSDSYDDDGVEFFHVRGTTALNTRAVQVPEKASSLNSGDCFILVLTGKSGGGTVYIWTGKHSNKDERANALSISEYIKGKRDVKTVEEGAEPADFWSALGGKGSYSSAPPMPEIARDPRLFQCSNASGAFSVEEIFDFTQDDLDKDDVFLLDCYSEFFVWVGGGSNEIERKNALETAVKYIAEADDGRDKDTPVYRINSGFEPPNFTAQFLGWDPVLAKSTEDPYERKLRETLGGEAPAMVSAQDALADYSKKYSYEDLKARKFPSTVDATKLEEYLEDAEFEKVFKMPRDAWLKLPGWKREGQKKAAKLF